MVSVEEQCIIYLSNRVALLKITNSNGVTSVEIRYKV